MFLRKNSPYIQSERYKPLHTDTEGSSLERSKNIDAFKQTQLHVEAGHVAGILLYAINAQSSTVPFPKLQRKNISDDIPTFRTFERPSDICKIKHLDRPHHGTRRHTSTGTQVPGKSCITKHLMKLD